MTAGISVAAFSSLMTPDVAHNLLDCHREVAIWRALTRSDIFWRNMLFSTLHYTL